MHANVTKLIVNYSGLFCLCQYVVIIHALTSINFRILIATYFFDLFINHELQHDFSDETVGLELEAPDTPMLERSDLTPPPAFAVDIALLIEPFSDLKKLGAIRQMPILDEQ